MAAKPDGAEPDQAGRGVPEPPWRSEPRRRSVPRPQLSREVVVQAALEVLEGGGGQALTMRRVADQIGVSASSLYGYVANKEELIQLVLDRIIEEIDIPPAGGDWQDRLKDFGRALLGVFRRHPGVAELSLGRVPVGPSMLAAGEILLGELRSVGIPDQVAAYVGDLAGLYVGAFAYEQEVTAWPGRAEDLRPQLTAWFGSLPPDRFPNTVALASALVAGDGDDRFEWGMDVIIRGVASFLDQPPDPRAHWPAWPVPPGASAR
jgi:TetR/AcrR family transcriptional regulator, tetracycline repressor protein